ncbi:cytidylyltransferase domain-containing protein [Sphingomonas sp. ac-8]|uniref:acylneuraminate cytidylyltransferase family protein n=1 Tax=Sphingomonas sp. ac-8 TaxID=3242977 RepID=UPI003A805166
MSILGLIPARGGSKGIPRKNVLPMAGKPLIAWTIEAALAAGNIDRVVVTTDDAEIAEVASQHGADVPFLRPADLARDETPGIDPVLHAIDALPGYDIVVLLQPTSPLRTAADIDAAAAMARTGTGVVSVTEAPHAGWIFEMNAGGALDIGAAPPPTRRQDMPTRYALNGAIYVADTKELRESRSFLLPGAIGYVMPAERSVDIDGPLDWRLAELLLADRGG